MLFCELTLQLEGYGRNPAEKCRRIPKKITNNRRNNKEPKKGFPYGGFFIQYATQNLCMVRVLNNYLFSGKPLAHGFPKLIIIISKIDITKE